MMEPGSNNRRGEQQNKKVHSVVISKKSGIQKGKKYDQYKRIIEERRIEEEKKKYRKCNFTTSCTDKWFIRQRIEELKRVYLYRLNNNSNNENSSNDYERIWNDIEKKIKIYNEQEKCEKKKKEYGNNRILPKHNYHFINNTLLHTFRILGKEIVYLVNIFKPSKNEIFMRRLTLRRLSELCNVIYPNSYMMLFGSCNSKLDIYHSDIDLCVYTPSRSSKKDIHIFYTYMKKGHDFFRKAQIKKILRAKVPILKCYFPDIRLSVDISFNQLSAITSTVYIQGVLKKKKQLRYIFIFLKMLLSQYDVNDASTGGISSYNFFLILMKFISNHSFAFEGKDGVLYIGEVVYKFCVYLSLYKDQSMMKHFLRNANNFDLSKIDTTNIKLGSSGQDEPDHMYSLFIDIFYSFEIQDPTSNKPNNTITFSKIFKMRRGFKEAHETLVRWILHHVQTVYSEMCLKYQSVTKGVTDFLCFLDYRSDYFLNMDLVNCYKKEHEERKRLDIEEYDCRSNISNVHNSSEWTNWERNNVCTPYERELQETRLNYMNHINNAPVIQQYTNETGVVGRYSAFVHYKGREYSVNKNHEQRQINYTGKRDLFIIGDTVPTNQYGNTNDWDFQKRNKNEPSVDSNFIRNINTVVRNSENPLHSVFDEAAEKKKRKNRFNNEDRNYTQINEPSFRNEPKRTYLNTNSMNNNDHSTDAVEIKSNPMSSEYMDISESEFSFLSFINTKIKSLFGFIDDHNSGYQKDRVNDICRDFNLIAKLLQLESLVHERFKYYYHLKKHYKGSIDPSNIERDEYKEKQKHMFRRILKCLKNYDENILNKYDINSNIYA